jgi:hypothetical protein
VWVVISDNEPFHKTRPRTLWLARADGLAVPLVADPDGVLLVPGVPPGPVFLELAPAVGDDSVD